MPDLLKLLARLPAASPSAFDLNARRCHRLDLTQSNDSLRGIDPADVSSFSDWVRSQISRASADYAAGGYAEDRALYRMSPVFQTSSGEARTVHLAIDLWLPQGSSVYSVLPGKVHSAADNAAFGDYGPAIIVEHHVGAQRFYTLFGHLARSSLARMRAGRVIGAAEEIGALGAPRENGGWPPHLHFQVIRDMEGRSGDYPGVCVPSERVRWLERCPDPNLLLRIAALGPPADRAR